MHAIAIICGDPGYDATFQALLETIRSAASVRPPLTPGAVEGLLRAGIAYHYLAFQNRYTCQNGLAAEEHAARTAALLAGRLQIRFDQAADLSLAHERHGGGAWHLECQSGVITRF